jgi:hypothetical protein
MNLTSFVGRIFHCKCDDGILCLFILTISSCRWDERFVGYGFDKVSHTSELHQAGYSFYGAPNVFVIHWDHGVPRWRDKGDLVSF